MAIDSVGILCYHERKTKRMNTMKKWKWILLILAAVVVLSLFVGPRLLLAAARQPEVAQSYAYSESFCTTYDQTRHRLQMRVESLTAAGVKLQQESYAIDEADGLYIDSLYLPSTGENTNLVVLTTGVHGMEGYIGSVMLDVFFEEIYPTLHTTIS